jgi:hypothetical protein
MAHYYVYILDDAGHVKAREIVSADDDSRAIDKARTYLGAHPSIPALDVWLAERRIKKLWQVKHSPTASGIT